MLECQPNGFCGIKGNIQTWIGGDCPVASMHRTLLKKYTEQRQWPIVLLGFWLCTQSKDKGNTPVEGMEPSKTELDGLHQRCLDRGLFYELSCFPRNSFPGMWSQGLCLNKIPLLLSVSRIVGCFILIDLKSLKHLNPVLKKPVFTEFPKEVYAQGTMTSKTEFISESLFQIL